MVHVGNKSPWAGAVIAVVSLYCLTTVGCSGFSYVSNHASVSTGGSGSGGSGGGGTNPLPPTSTISGSITPATLGAGIAVSLTGAETVETTTDGSGNYRFSGLPSGNYTVTPVKSNVVFSPASLNITATGSPITGANFSASAPAASSTISGSITPATLGAGITVNLTGAETAETATDGSGNYTFSGLPSGNYTVTPVKSNVVFSPASLNITATGSPIAGANFSASAPLIPSGPIVINGENGTTIQGLKITSTTGDCVTIINSSNVTILNSEVGPCTGNGIKINGGTGINIYDSYIHTETLATGCCDTNDGIFAYGGTSNLTIQGNVIAYGESNIEVQGGTTVAVVGNFLLNPRGPRPRGQNFQCWNNCSEVSVENNYTISSTNTSQFLYPDATEDSISFGVSSSFIVRNNFITGGQSPSGCGIMADTFSNDGQILQNLLLHTGQCGIGLTDGSHLANENHIYNTNPVTGGGNTAMYVSHLGQSATCGPMTITNNVADEIRSDGTHSGWWNAGNCGTIDISTDVFGAVADSALTPVSTVFVPPLIPPVPKNCVALSPYSTQTSASACIP
jgi:Right handed beta helix region